MKVLICLFCGSLVFWGHLALAGETATEAPSTPATAAPVAPTAPTETAPGVAVSGTPRLVRSLQKTEVFFSDLNKSYFIPEGDSHNEVMAKFLKGIKAKKPMSFQAHPVSRDILRLNDTSAEVKP